MNYFILFSRFHATSLNDEVKNVDFLIKSEYGIYEQGLRYVSNMELINKEKTKYNYVKDIKI